MQGKKHLQHTHLDMQYRYLQARCQVHCTTRTARTVTRKTPVRPLKFNALNFLGVVYYIFGMEELLDLRPRFFILFNALNFFAAVTSIYDFLYPGVNGWEGKCQ